MTTGDNANAVQALAWQAARLGEAFLAAIRAGEAQSVAAMLAADSPAAMLFELFGLAWLRLDLRLDDPREADRLAPYDLQLEGEIGLLELGVLLDQPDPDPTATERSHVFRLFGSGLVLQRVADQPSGWQIVEVLPVNADGQLHPDDPTDGAILHFHQGLTPLPLQTEHLSLTEGLFLGQLQSQARFNLEELLNARRLWQDYFHQADAPRSPDESSTRAAVEAGAIEYLISLFDYHQAEADEIAARYGVGAEALSDQAREITAALHVTQFDDRYTIHRDPVAHYRELFGELGIDPRRDEKIRLAAGRPIFDSVEVPPDDDTFFGPGE